MLKTLVTHLQAFVVLTCPFLCLGDELEIDVVRPAAHGCACCGQPLDSDNDAPPGPEQRDPECFCHGAILDGAKAGGPEYGFDSPMTAFLAFDACANMAAMLYPDLAPHTGHFPPILSGRDICALTCVRLL